LTARDKTQQRGLRGEKTDCRNKKIVTTEIKHYKISKKLECKF